MRQKTGAVVLHPMPSSRLPLPQSAIPKLPSIDKREADREAVTSQQPDLQPPRRPARSDLSSGAHACGWAAGAAAPTPPPSPDSQQLHPLLLHMHMPQHIA